MHGCSYTTVQNSIDCLTMINHAYDTASLQPVCAPVDNCNTNVNMIVMVTPHAWHASYMGTADLCHAVQVDIPMRFYLSMTSSAVHGSQNHAMHLQIVTMMYLQMCEHTTLINTKSNRTNKRKQLCCSGRACSNDQDDREWPINLQH